MTILYILAVTVQLLLGVVNVALLVRCLLSLFFMPEEGGFLMTLATAVTEPFLTPARVILSRFSFFEGLPVDFSPVVTVFIIYALQLFLPVPVL